MILSKRPILRRMFVLREMIFEGVCLEMSRAQTQLLGPAVLPLGKEAQWHPEGVIGILPNYQQSSFSIRREGDRSLN